jgi:hypothetical protein
LSAPSQQTQEQTPFSFKKLLSSDERLYVKIRIAAFVLASVATMAGLVYWAYRPQHYVVAVPSESRDERAKIAKLGGVFNSDSQYAH